MSSSGGSGNGVQVVKIRREALAACMTCPLCNNLLREATTISLCLHTFCRKCIYDKLSDEEVDTCPVCDIDLGCVPVEKLRPDHSLQDIRARIFPFKRKKTKSSEVIMSNSLPVKRKERSLSSLVVTAPKTLVQTGVTGKRTRYFSRKNVSARGFNFSIEKSVKREHASENCPESLSSGETLNKVIQDRKQSAPATKAFNHQSPKKDGNNDAEIRQPNVDLWKPLNFLVEAANRTKPSKVSPQGSCFVKSEPTTSNAIEELNAPKIKEHPNNTGIQVDRNGKSSSGVVRRKRLRAVDRQNYSPQTIVDLHGAKLIRTCPIWFSLVASDNQEGDIPLPQLPACYLRVKDGELPVSFIQKYLVKKLDLTSESEVEILCHGQPVMPTLRLRSLIDLWSQLEPPSKRLRTCLGSSAKEFVMALSYSRRIDPSPGKQ